MSFLAHFRILTKILAIVVVMAAVAAGISFLGIHALASLNDGADNMKFAAQRALDAARANQNVIALNARRANDGRATTTAYVGLHVGEVFYGNIGHEDRLDFTVVGPAVNEVSRIASMCRSVDRELLISSAFRGGLDATGQRYLVSTGRFALRGIGRAQDLFTLDPEVTADEVAGGGYARYLAS